MTTGLHGCHAWCRASPARRSRTFRNSAFGALLVAACFSTAAGADTTVVSDGSRRSYRIGPGSIDSGSVVVRAGSGVASPPLPFSYDPHAARVHLDMAPDSGDTVHIVWATNYLGLPRTLSLFPPVEFDTTSADRRGTGVVLRRERGAGTGSPLNVTGYKSIGVSVGSGGAAALTQGLDVSVEGRVGRRARLKAHISDLGTSLDGGTRELSEVDLVYLTLSHPLYTLTVGDQFVRWPSGGMIEDSRKMKGLSAALTTPAVDVRVFGAISGGRYAVETFYGRDGLQGPYVLNGNGEPDLISPVGGTVDVSVDGEKLSEGDDKDFVVDYDFGTLTFAPHVLMSADRVVRVAYEYKTFDYQRLMAGTDAALRLGDSVFSVSGALWYEADNENEPIDLSLSPADREILELQGDSSIERLVGVPIDSRDVEEWSSRYWLYAQRDTLGTPYFAATTPDPEDPASSGTLYWVSFRTVPDSSGDYVVDSVDYRGERYRYVGPGAGTATAGNLVTLPQRTVVGEVIARLRPASWLALSVDVVGTHHDRNLFSPQDDGDNNGAATWTHVQVGRRAESRRSLWLRADHRLFTRHFSRESMSGYEAAELWHTAALDSGRVERQLWEAASGGSLGRALTAEVAFGQIISDGDVLTDRLTATAATSPWSRFRLSYTGRFYRHAQDTLDLSRVQQLEAGLDLERLRLSAGASSEWRHNDRYGHGEVGVDGGIEWRKPLIRESISYRMHGRGEGLQHTMVDTGYSLVWEQRLDMHPSRFWKLTGMSTWRLRSHGSDSTRESTLLVRATNDLSFPDRGLSTRVDYTLSSEQASALVQVPTYTGQGLGTHSYDSLRGELVPDNNGDYLLSEQEVLDRSTGGGAPVRKTRLQATWTFKPRRAVEGILGDLRWWGELLCVEDVLADSTSTGWSWVPGYLTLSGREPEAVRLANCYYEQRISWDPDSLRGLSADLRVRPYVRITNSGRDQGLAGAVGGRRTREKWQFRLQTDAKRYAHEGLTDFDVTDISGLLEQKRLIVHHISAYARETVGWASRDDASGWYGSIGPGLSWQPPGKGWADVSYVFAYVDIPGDLDYGMAGGYRGGITHRIDVRADVRIGDHFELGGSYRGEFVKPLEGDRYEDGLHVISAEVKALL